MTTDAPTGLPELETDCTDCPTPEHLVANGKALNAWTARYDAAWLVFHTAHSDEEEHVVHAMWCNTEEHPALMDEKPEELVAGGCVECDWTGRVLTPAGKILAQFIRQRTAPKFEQLDRRIDRVDEAVQEVGNDLDNTRRNLGNQVRDLEYR